MKAILLDGTHATDATGNRLRETLAAQLQAPGLKCQALMGKPIVPRWVYLLAGKRRWNTQAKHYGSGKWPKHRPYQAMKVTR